MGGIILYLQLKAVTVTKQKSNCCKFHQDVNYLLRELPSFTNHHSATHIPLFSPSPNQSSTLNNDQQFHPILKFSFFFHHSKVLLLGREHPLDLMDTRVIFHTPVLPSIPPLANLHSPDIFPIRMSGNSPLCLTGHRPFGVAAVLSLHYFS